MKEHEIKSRAETVIVDCFRKIPAVKNVQIQNNLKSSDVDIDLLVDIYLPAPSGRSQITLLVQVKPNGQPRWARIAADSLRSALERQRRENGDTLAYGLLVAPYISEKSASILDDKGIGYLDLAGNGLLAVGPIYFEAKGNPNPVSARSELRTLFSPKASRIVRVMLQEPYRPWRLASLAEAAGVSIGLVAKSKPLLLDREWAKDTSKGLVLIDPASALKTWANHFRRPKEDFFDYYGFGSITEIEDRVASAASNLGVRYALAEFSGAERIAPSVRYNRAALYVKQDRVEDVAASAELRPVATGANVRLFRTYDEGVFFGTSTASGLTVANPIQLYLDLEKARGRGGEAAEFLLRQWLKPRWEVAAQQSPAWE